VALGGDADPHPDVQRGDDHARAAERLAGAGRTLHREDRVVETKLRTTSESTSSPSLPDVSRSASGRDGGVSKLRPGDILVVAPYNLAVRCVDEAVPDGVRVGTVDRFQGQQAAVVFYALTCSSGEDVPRGLDPPASSSSHSGSPIEVRH